MKFRSGLTALALLATLSACESTWYEARFAPAPLEVELKADGAPAAQARALLTVVGIKRAAEGQPAQVVARLRIDNLGESTVALVPESLECVSGDLVSMGAPSLDQDPGTPLARGESRVWTASFPMPPGHTPENLDWRGLNLKWTVAFGERRTTTGVTFDRVFPGAYDPYWGGSNVSLGVGVSVGH